MSNCKYTELVTPNTCLGDSLATFNDNFFKLDNALCAQPIFLPNNGVRVSKYLTEQNINAVRIGAGPAAIYNNTFEDYQNGAFAGFTSLADNTRIPTVTFPVPETSASNPSATFSAISHTNLPPRVTIYWTASGADYTTIYATNSATSISTDIGGFGGFNGPITALLSSGDFVYVGGSFTSVGNNEFRKFCVINLKGGTDPNIKDALGNYVGGNVETVGQIVQTPVYDSQLGRYVSHPLVDNGGFGLEGTITSIAQSGDLLIIGGTYKNVPGKNLGRGLTIWNSRTKKVYPFYVNGDVNVVHVESNELYVGGVFDFINYGPLGASDISGQRIYTNGLAKISLSLIESFANKSITPLFCENIRTAFDKQAIIYTITSTPVTGAIYIGGDFKCYSDGRLIASSVGIVSPEGIFSSSWQPIIEGVVHKLLIDENTLYAAGAFSYYFTASDLELTPKPYKQFYNLICFDIQSSYYPELIPSWRPKTNGPVFDVAIHNGENGTRYLYCYGNFDEINGVDVGFLGAVPRNAGTVNNINEAQIGISWSMYLNKPPHHLTKALLRVDKSILIGGNFSEINSQQRQCLGRVNGPFEQVITEQPVRIVWNLGSQLIGVKGNLMLDFTKYASVTASSAEFGKINRTTFPLEYTKSVFDGYTEGSLMRFFVRREYDTRVTTLTSPVFVTGWKLEFDNN